MLVNVFNSLFYFVLIICVIEFENFIFLDLVALSCFLFCIVKCT